MTKIKLKQKGMKARKDLKDGDIISNSDGQFCVIANRETRHMSSRVLILIKEENKAENSLLWMDADDVEVKYYGNVLEDFTLEEEKSKPRPIDRREKPPENFVPYWLGVELLGGQKLLINLVERDVEILVDEKNDEWDYVNGVEQREIGMIIPMKDQAGRETRVAIETVAPYTINRAIDDHGLWTNVTDAKWVVSHENGFVFHTTSDGNVYSVNLNKQ